MRQARHVHPGYARLPIETSAGQGYREVVDEGSDSLIRRIPPTAASTKSLSASDLLSCPEPLDSKSISRFCHDKLCSLINTLEIDNTDDYLPFRLISDLGTLIGTYSEGFQIVVELYNEQTIHSSEPVLQMASLDASIAMAMTPVFEKYFMCKMVQPFPLSEQAQSLLTERQVLQLKQTREETDVGYDAAYCIGTSHSVM